MTRVASVGIGVVVGIGIVLGCGAAEDDPPSARSASAAVREVADRFERAVRESEAEAFADLFTADARYASNDGRLWQGRDEILAAARQWMQVPQEPERTTLEVKVAGDFAYMLERYSSVVRPPDAPPRTVTGNSLAVFRWQRDGGWKIDALVVGRDPAPPEDDATEGR